MCVCRFVHFTKLTTYDMTLKRPMKERATDGAVLLDLQFLSTFVNKSPDALQPVKSSLYFPKFLDICTFLTLVLRQYINALTSHG